MNILEALSDQALFAQHFRGDTWKPWKAFLAALFALPMDDEALTAYRHHTGRTAPPAAAFKEVALVIGRRGGKSRVLALIATYLACFGNYEPFLAPGEVATVAVLAATRQQARSIFRFVSGLLGAVPFLKRMIVEETSDTILLKNRVQIEIATASFRVTRGYTYAAILADETAFWRDETSANPDEEIFKALRPGMATIPGAILLNASSPYRKKGVLYSTYKRHYGKDGARVLVWKAASLEMNPSLDAEVVKEAFEDDPASAAAEYGGNFREDIQDFVDRAAVEACVEPGRFELPKIWGVEYFGFVDLSGGGADSMALAIAHRGPDGKGVLDLVREIKGPTSPEGAVIEFSTALKSYDLMKVTGDRYAGEWPRERFREHGITYEPSELPKSGIYQNLLPLLNSGKLELLDNKTLVAQLCGLERRTARGGRDSIDHAPGAHDDVANAAAGALLPMAGKLSGLELWLRMVD